MRAGTKYLFLAFALVPLVVLAQKENSTWYFGQGLGLKFDGTNVSVLPHNNNVHAYWGSSTVSDPVTGQLLFYTNGHDIWGSDDLILQNGQNIIDVFSLPAVEVVSVPYPGRKGVYYVFTTGYYNKLYYALVDMNANGGKGAVTIKNQLLKDSVTNNFTIVRQAYDKGYWLVTHAASSIFGSDTFISYRITQNGLDVNPVKSRTGYAVTPHAYISGEMTSSGDGTRIFFSFLGKAGLFQFNKACGDVTMLTSLSEDINPGINFITGAFSPDDTKLYAGYNWERSVLCQFDLTRPANKIYDLRKVLMWDDVSKGNKFGTMELGPDGRIYIASADHGSVTDKLDVIHQPNKDGNDCAYESWFINPPEGDVYFTEALPNLIQDRNPAKGFEKPDLNISQACIAEKSVFALKNKPVADSITWDFGDPATGSNNNSHDSLAFHTYAAGGEYTITFTWYICGYLYTQTKTIYVSDRPISRLAKEVSLCLGDSMLINAGSGPGLTYRWENGTTDSTIRIAKPGVYRVSISKGSCTITDSILVKQYPDIWVRLGREYFICEEENELQLLDAGKGFKRYLWHPTGDTTQWIKVEKTGDYYVIVDDFNGCKGTAGTVVKRKCPQHIYFPNAFSPNGDGINDVFKAKGQDIVSYSISVYNRWGEKVFEATDLSLGWDGKMNGKPAPLDVYFWQVSFSGFDTDKTYRKEHQKGTVTLVQ